MNSLVKNIFGYSFLLKNLSNHTYKLRKIGKYEILKELKEGQHDTVY
ncbi:hypothetical protein HMPREF3037_01214 [Candidatus Stoquefichus sp. KLE1796]|nr:hypothetical protein HMPREF3037_01214 [Candidatus Stoquefichus sp. KLE1796]